MLFLRRRLLPGGAWLTLVLMTLFPALGRSAEEKATSPADVPLKKVVIFTSGVGLFERLGEVEGNTSLDLKFNVESINDLLKSMIVEDLGGGRVSAVNYGSRDPITKTPKTFSLDLTGNPTLGQLLDQARGEEVELEAADSMKGTIVGVERRKREIGKDHDTVEAEYLNLLTDGGLRSVPLDTVSRIRLTDAKVDAELRQALKILALGHSTDKKTVSLKFLGQGKRQVRVGYLQEMPLWKTSYRLVLADGKDPFLQGWAIVENTTEDDWNNVNLTLVSGRPISFTMDLYQPLYPKRPMVEPELFASLRPQQYDLDFLKSEGRDLQGVAGKPTRYAFNLPGAKGGRREQEMAADEKDKADFIPAPAGPASSSSASTEFNLRSAGQSMATAGDVGSLFQYAISSPVTLPRQQSAMLPIINDSVKGEKVSIYNERVQAKHPLCGLKLKNSTNLHLMQGPITVLDGGSYAGDGQIADLAPGAERLISYAVDLDLEVAPEGAPQLDELVSVRLNKGLMFITRKQTQTRKYTVKNSGKQEKNLLIEQPIQPDWKLVKPKAPAEQTRGMYRFAVAAGTDKPATLVVNEQRTLGEQVAVTNLGNDTVGFYLSQKVISEKVKGALREIVSRKQNLADASQARQRTEQQIATIGQEQERIRKNMEQLDRNSELYLRYMKKFSQQEDQIEKLRAQAQSKTDEEARLRKDLDDYLSHLEVE